MSLSILSQVRIGPPGDRRILKQILHPLLPWVPFIIMLAWRWRLLNPFTKIPFYGDSLEVLWGVSWFQQLFEPGMPFSLVYPGLFHPEGLQVVVFGHGPGTFLLLLPFALVGGLYFGLNAGNLALLFLGYAGTYKLTRSLKGSQFSAILAAMLFTFWDMRWGRLLGHFNILIGTTFLPWMLWSLERGIASISQGSPTRKYLRALLLTGLFWAIASSASLYFVWIGGLSIALWLLSRRLNRHINSRQVLLCLLTVGLTMGILIVPLAFQYIRGLEITNVRPWDLITLNRWGASLNSLPIPAIDHPWLDGIAQAIYRAPIHQPDQAELGLALSIVALISVPVIWRKEGWRPLIILAIVSLVLGLGVSLKWDGESIRSSFFTPLDKVIWSIGHFFKPSVFPSQKLPLEMTGVIPLPGMLLDAIVPFWEGARVAARYIFLTGLAAFIMVALFTGRLRSRWLKWLLAAILLFEIVPYQISGREIPDHPHPAFTWMRDNLEPGTGIVDLIAAGPGKIQLKIDGETLWATRFHGDYTVSGASSVIPGYTQLLIQELHQMEGGLASPTLAPILRFFQARYIVLHLMDVHSHELLPGIEANENLELINCFDPLTGVDSPWRYRICVIEIKPADQDFTNLLLGSGWSGREAWGTWVEGRQAGSRFFATREADHRLEISVFPHCVPGDFQKMTIVVNNQVVDEKAWTDCETWDTSILLPASIIEEGWNKLDLNFGYAISPADIESNLLDGRQLSAAFEMLTVSRIR